jgi:cysteine desulfurase family protein (TIGR01976 family)
MRRLPRPPGWSRPPISRRRDPPVSDAIAVASARAGPLDVVAVRARFAALDRPLAFLDGPGGSQCPNEVIDAIAGYLRRDNANVGGAFETSIRSEALVETAHDAAGRFLSCGSGEAMFGPSMTALNFLLSRAFGRELTSRDEVLVTKLDHDANISPWLELKRDVGVAVRFVDLREDLSIDLDDLERKLSARTRVVAFPVAANAVGTLVDVRQIVDLAHEVDALAWADAVHYAPHGPIDVATWGVDVLTCSPYKFFGPHLGAAFVRQELLESWRPYKVRPVPDDPLGRRYELGTAQHELLAGFVAAVEYIESIGWERIVPHERSPGQRFLSGLPPGITLYGSPTMAGRVPTFAFTVPGRRPEEAARHLAQEHSVAVWWGDHYATEVTRYLGLHRTGGTVRAGMLHYNTAEEVDRLLEGIAALLSLRHLAGLAQVDAAGADGADPGRQRQLIQDAVGGGS